MPFFKKKYALVFHTCIQANFHHSIFHKMWNFSLIFSSSVEKIVSKKAGRLVLKKDMRVHLKDLFLLPMDLFCKSYSLMETWICVSLPVNKVKCYIKSIQEFLPGKITRGLWFWIVMNCILLRNRQILCIC